MDSGSRNLVDKRYNKGSVWIEYLSWVEAEKIFLEYDVFMIPLGARTKEHGPHLPLNNDWILAEYLSKRARNWSIIS